MALVLDGTVSNPGVQTGSNVANPVTWTHAGTAPNLVLVAFHLRISGTPTVTYGGTSMTAHPLCPILNGSDRLWAFYLASGSIPSGSQTVSVDIGGTGNSIEGGSIGYTGADTVTVFRTSSSATGASTTPSVTAVNSQSGDLVIGVLVNNSFTSSATSGTQRIFGESGGGDTVLSELLATGANTAMTFSQGSGDTWAALGIPLIPGAAAGRTTKNTRSAPLGSDVGMGMQMNG